VLNLVNCILGAGVLGYPFCFKSTGFALATVVMLISLLACRFSYQLLLYCCQLTTRRTYEEMAEQAVGRLGRRIVDFCTAALNLGSIVAYLNILADILSAVAGTIIPPGAEPSRSVYLAGEQSWS
jgi:sodium-coupled neutral amino acid transporter 10